MKCIFDYLKALSTPFIVVGIIGKMSKSYGFSENVVKYNNILKRLAWEYGVDYVFPCGGTLADGIHITIKAHDFLADDISGWIDDIKL